MNLWEELSRTIQDPHARHAMLVHLPIVLGTLGVLPLLGAAFTRFRNRSLVGVACACFVLATGGVLLAESAGEDAAEAVERSPLTSQAKATLEQHEELAEVGWVFCATASALCLGTLLTHRRPRLCLIAGGLSIVSALGVAGWVTLTAHEGGKLVYVHGVGVPAPGTATTSFPIGGGSTESGEHERR